MGICCENSIKLENDSAMIPASYQPDIFLSLVIPTYNERKNIALLIARLCDVLNRCLAGRYELIVVDDDSPDRTWEEAMALSQTNPRLKVLHRKGERSLSLAVMDGWKISEGE